MKTISSKTKVSRRKFIGAGATATALGVTAITLPITQNAKAVSPRFSNLKSLKPPPETILGSTTPPPMAALVLNKAAFGPRPGDIDAFNALGVDDDSRITAWVEQQLNPTATDPDLDSRLAFLVPTNAYDTINKTALQLWADHSIDDDYLIRNRPRWQMERLMIFRGVYSQWQLREMLNDFWFNHFNVKGSSFPTQGMLPHYNEEIRSRMFGNFYDMLEANSKTASMLFYLDNYRNSWPNPNENYAREVLELHTLGAIENYYGTVDPNTLGNNSKGQRTGYTEIDVFQFARALTGWSVADGNGGSADTGEFLFRSDQHYDEHGTESIKVLDVDIATDGGENDVTDILQYLADHFGTARFISWKLCTRFVGDNPPESLVASTAEEFYARRNDSDQLKEVYRHILLSPEFRSSWGAKIKRPVESIIAAMRATDVDIDFRNDHSPSNDIYYRLDETGQEPYDNDTPTGYPDEKPLWSGSGPLVSTWRTITYFLNRSGQTYDDSDTGETNKLRYCNLAQQANTEIPNTANRTPTQLVDMWMLRLRGYSYDSATRNRLITYVSDKSGATANQSIHDVTDTDNLSNSSTYHRVIYTLVGLIIMSPDAMRR